MEAVGRGCQFGRDRRVADLSDDPSDELISVLYKDFRETLFNQVLYLTGHDQQWTEDVVQETLIRAWQHSGTLNREPGMLRGWLLTVAKRIVIDGWRNRRARPQEVELDSSENAEIADRTDQSLSALVISEALRYLDVKYQAVIYETYLTGHTVREAAVILGIPEGTVKSRLYAAMRTLRRSLGELGSR
ncbi:sigma-70 family RNA polymerase sigma factor [Amycolatopsis sp. BJA-103]|uniref:sigma-70 family RNA polymerase sigma factor n=1 Tax=Amycolatopsis sp. BJA-103 TaxID=1911175 RepID=UPI000C787233|nr:sigma-70 family RNA polymerase sigma factor [Amycolatopsis sp. BJA-103]AUI63725.1 RNA polymerase subunit sigma [Amycolatopsis sp. BJA-103]PNE19570.1 RNA polymerase subunit sigma [Amycolatopsis sp. BJA-103]